VDIGIMIMNPMYLAVQVGDYTMVDQNGRSFTLFTLMIDSLRLGLILLSDEELARTVSSLVLLSCGKV
jgi:hypothetical protein